MGLNLWTWETTTKKITKGKDNLKERTKAKTTKERATAVTKANERATKETAKEKEDLRPKDQEMYATGVADRALRKRLPCPDTQHQ